MLLTLSIKAVWNLPQFSGRTSGPLDLPRWAREDLGVHGLTLQTSLFSGWEAARFDALRDAADKAGAPCLILVEDAPLALADQDPAKADAAVERAERVLRVASRLGCSSVAFSIGDQGNKATVESLTPRLKLVLGRAERMELNLLLAPAPGITENPEKLTGVIRKVGGFRIGSFPDFEAASKSPDPVGYLRSLAPYASGVCASFIGFDAKGQHKAYDVASYLDAIESVGYEAALTLEFRGKGDPVAGLRSAKSLIEARLADDVPAEDDAETIDVGEEDPDE
ncbi:MAG: hypothetical protein SFZ24_01435 [Planctomycetota bacterium]|nr:hypothetical protein [Planctomycetota bacterium]